MAIWNEKFLLFLSAKRPFSKLRKEKMGLSPQLQKYVITLIKHIMNYGKKTGIRPLPEKLSFPTIHLDNEKTEAVYAEQLAVY